MNKFINYNGLRSIMPGIGANETYDVGREQAPDQLPTASPGGIPLETLMRWHYENGISLEGEIAADQRPKQSSRWLSCMVEPPPTYPPHAHPAAKTPATPFAAHCFFYFNFIAYGAAFGAAYGTGFGLLIFLIGAIIGLPVGILTGLILGFFDGLVLGCVAPILIANRVSVLHTAVILRRLAPFVTVIGGGLLLAGVGKYYGNVWYPFTDAFCLIGYGLSVIASYHAACVVTKKFIEEFE